MIFGGGQQKEIRTEQRDANDEIASPPRNVLAGRRKNRISNLRSALEAARDAPRNRFVILEKSDQFWMQCLCTETGWLLEKREGDEEQHFRATVKSVEPEEGNGEEDLMSRIFAKRKEPTRYLNFGQVLEAMNRYHEGKPEPDWLEWEGVGI